MPSVKAVLDTNVVVSALLKQEGREALILGLAIGQRFQPVASEELLAEYGRVLARPRFRFIPNRAQQAIRNMRQASLIVAPKAHPLVCHDPDDDMVVACAVAGNADFIVTGNQRDFPAE